jgi:hypothetical protein
MREMGAQKAGRNVSGDAWREAWTERVYYEAASGEPFVERNAQKWASEGIGNQEWEEKWGEQYGGAGDVNKWAYKWGKLGGDVCFHLSLQFCSCPMLAVNSVLALCIIVSLLGSVCVIRVAAVSDGMTCPLLSHKHMHMQSL